MPLLNREEFVRAVPAGARAMALDVGSKTIGLATGIMGSELVMPLKTLSRVKFTRDAETLLQIMGEYDVQGLVIGWPLNRDGSEGKRCQSVKDFTAELMRFLTSKVPSPLRGEGQGGSVIPVTFWDERFSTAIGDDMVDNIGKTAGKALNKTKRDDIIDSLAAQQILQDFMSRHSPNLRQ
jgi:putative holliday junction resolvase